MFYISIFFIKLLFITFYFPGPVLQNTTWSQQYVIHPQVKGGEFLEELLTTAAEICKNTTIRVEDLFTGEAMAMTLSYVGDKNITYVDKSAAGGSPFNSDGSCGFWEWDCGNNTYYLVPITLSLVALLLVCCFSFMWYRASGNAGDLKIELTETMTALQMSNLSEKRVVVLLVSVDDVLVKKRSGTMNNRAFDFNDALMEALGCMASEAAETGSTIKFILLHPEQMTQMKPSKWSRSVQHRDGADVNIYVDTATQKSSWVDPTSLVSAEWLEMQYLDSAGRQKALYVNQDRAYGGEAKKKLHSKPAGFDDGACRPINAIQANPR